MRESSLTGFIYLLTPQDSAAQVLLLNWSYFGGHNGNSGAQWHGPYIINIGININTRNAD